MSFKEEKKEHVNELSSRITSNHLLVSVHEDRVNAQNQ